MPIDRTIEGSWNGSLFSASAIASQELWAGSFFIRPSAGVEYYSLSEDSYDEEGGGSALDLSDHPIEDLGESFCFHAQSVRVRFRQNEHICATLRMEVTV